MEVRAPVAEAGPCPVSVPFGAPPVEVPPEAPVRESIVSVTRPV